MPSATSNYYCPHKSEPNILESNLNSLKETFFPSIVTTPMTKLSTYLAEASFSGQSAWEPQSFFSLSNPIHIILMGSTSINHINLIYKQICYLLKITDFSLKLPGIKLSSR